MTVLQNKPVNAFWRSALILLMSVFAYTPSRATLPTSIDVKPSNPRINAGQTHAFTGTFSDGSTQASGLPVTAIAERQDHVGRVVEDAKKAQVQKTYGNLPLYFIRNDGQVDGKVRFYEKGNGHATFFTKEGVYLTLNRKTENKAVDDNTLRPSSLKTPKGARDGAREKITSELVKLTFLNANKNPEIIAVDPQEGKVNYFVGNDQKKWKTNVPTYRAVVYQEMYPGIDIKFYGNNRHMEYDIVVKLGADPSKVKLAYSDISVCKGDLS